MAQSNRTNDQQQERILHQFLLKYFFNKVYNKVESIYDAETQISGIDVIADGQLIDTKAQLSENYLNNPTNTFILELSFLSKNLKEIVGWFLNPNSKTTVYAFVWIPKTRVVMGMIPNPEAIEEVEILLVDKTKLKDRINKWRSDDDLLGVARWMRQTITRKKECTLDGVKLVQSAHLFEQPTNIVAQKWFLKQFSLGHYIVTKTNIQKID